MRARSTPVLHRLPGLFEKGSHCFAATACAGPACSTARTAARLHPVAAVLGAAAACASAAASPSAVSANSPPVQPQLQQYAPQGYSQMAYAPRPPSRNLPTWLMTVLFAFAF